MPIARDAIYLRSGFTVEVDNIPALTNVLTVSPPGGHAAIIYYRSGGDPSNYRPMRGNVSLYPVTMQRGFNGQLELFDWWQQVRAGSPAARRNVRIDLLDETRQPVLRWLLRNAFPSIHRFSTLDANSNELLVEEVELVYEDYTLE